MPGEVSRQCPRCGSHDLECRELGVRGAFWRVAFGSGFGKEDIVAYACRQCRFIFLELVQGISIGHRAGRLLGRFRRHRGVEHER